MTPQQITLVRDSFATVQTIAKPAAALFYKNLFESDPTVHLLFRGDMEKQGALLLGMIGGAVRLLDKPEMLMPILHKLGAGHIAYGVKDSHYPLVGAALIKTLGQGLGDAFTPEAQAAWEAAYAVMAAEMISAAREAGATA
ncbi:MAG: hypothetical protein JWQ11_3097 [Rhizobacter sp.]|nr:hypothetical protein [Rhizobacter sp.]